MGETAADAVLLHGFSGTRRTWDPVLARLDAERYRPLALDLRGHGEARNARPITFAACTADVLGAAPDRFALAGYSMGGRIALHVALAAPERVTRLVLVSTTAGLEREEERAARRASDAALADRLEREGLEAFAAEWARQPLFADDPAWVAEAALADRRRNAPHGLAASLRGVGTGSMDSLWPRLGELTMPVAIVTGERDAKFTAIGERLREAIARARHSVVAGAGHSVQLEAPEAVVEALSA